MKTITIRELKHIDELTFEIPLAGVYLLTGSNGSGKTSLLACLRRIGQSNAFATHFAASQRSDILDNFSGAQITYTLDEKSVTYAYAGERWVPRPRSNNGLLGDFGYPSVFYIGATADRITPRPEDFDPRRLGTARQEIRDAANQIFGTRKFDGLKTINLTRGAGNPAFLLQATPPPGATYYSERNFSLGELCILKLVRELMSCADRSLLLIDELELALHPRAQIELLKYLTEMASRKNLTVIFSTHSVSLLKQIDRKNILFLEADGKIVRCVRGCYPTYALGNISYDEERAPDVVIYVEDDAALYATEAMVRLCIGARFEQEHALYPTVHVIPIGPFASVVRFLTRGGAALPPRTTLWALLDADVREETVAAWQLNNNHAELAEFQNHGNRIQYLPWTPEVGLVEFLANPDARAERAIREKYQDHRIAVRQQDIGVIPVHRGGEQRRACKAAVTRVCEHVAAQLPQGNVDEVRRSIFSIFASHYFGQNRGKMMALFTPMVVGR